MDAGEPRMDIGDALYERLSRNCSGIAQWILLAMDVSGRGLGRSRVAGRRQHGQ